MIFFEGLRRNFTDRPEERAAEGQGTGSWTSQFRGIHFQGNSDCYEGLAGRS